MTRRIICLLTALLFAFPLSLLLTGCGSSSPSSSGPSIQSGTPPPGMAPAPKAGGGGNVAKPKEV